MNTQGMNYQEKQEFHNMVLSGVISRLWVRPIISNVGDIDIIPCAFDKMRECINGFLYLSSAILGASILAYFALNLL